MNKFSDFNIAVPQRNFVGDKIKIDRLLNRPIIVHDYKIEKSKFETTSGKRLHMQIEVNGNKHVVFSGSVYLMDMIEKIDKSGFPFETTIVKQDDHLQFT